MVKRALTWNVPLLSCNQIPLTLTSLVKAEEEQMEAT